MRVEILGGIGQSGDYLRAPLTSIEVEQGKWARGYGELVTLDIGPCIALAAYNDTTGEGLLGHFSAISPEARRNPQLVNEHFDTDGFIEAVRALPALGPVATTEIWLGGGAIGRETSTIFDRRYAQETIADIVTQSGEDRDMLTVQWNDSGYDMAVRLNCRLGVLQVRYVMEERWPPV